MDFDLLELFYTWYNEKSGYNFVHSMYERGVKRTIAVHLQNDGNII